MTSLLEVISGLLVPLLLLLAGGYFFVLLVPRLKIRKGESGERGGARALGVALAGTLGVGNIAGVATAIALGGAGAIFWMWISAILAMFLKYAEVVLAVKTRIYDEKGMPHGGAPYYIRRIFPTRWGSGLAAFFAALCVVCSLTLGGVMQSAAAAESMQSAFGVPPLLTGCALGVGAFLILATGARGVERACTMIVPFMCVLFVLFSLVALVLRREAIPAALGSIFKNAFRFQSAGAGFLGFFTSRALRYGVARGLVSNEAGCGTAPIAHAATPCRSAERQGLFGMVEVAVDTLLLCTVTALVILVSGVSDCGGGGMDFAITAYTEILGAVAAPVLSVSVLLFAFATVLCWAHYGSESLFALTRKERMPRAYLVALFVAVAWGSVAAPGFVWDATDLVLGVMAIINITVLFFSRRDVLPR